MIADLWKTDPINGPPARSKSIVELVSLTRYMRAMLLCEGVEDGFPMLFGGLVLNFVGQQRRFRIEGARHGTVRRNQLIPNVASGWDKNVAGIVNKEGYDPDAIQLRRGYGYAP